MLHFMQPACWPQVSPTPVGVDLKCFIFCRQLHVAACSGSDKASITSAFLPCALMRKACDPWSLSKVPLNNVLHVFLNEGLSSWILISRLKNADIDRSIWNVHHLRHVLAFFPWPMAAQRGSLEDCSAFATASSAAH